MTKTTTDQNGKPQPPDAQVRYGQSGNTMLFWIRRTCGARPTHDVVMQEKRYIYPALFRAWLGTMLGLLVLGVWLLTHIAHDLNLLLAKEMSR